MSNYFSGWFGTFKIISISLQAYVHSQQNYTLFGGLFWPSSKFLALEETEGCSSELTDCTKKSIELTDHPSIQDLDIDLAASLVVQWPCITPSLVF